MIQCSECEFYATSSSGQPILRCDPFSNIKEPNCLSKWQIYHLAKLTAAYEATVALQKRLAPLQEKMMRHLEREIDEYDESERWKIGFDDEDDDEEEDDDDDEPRFPGLF